MKGERPILPVKLCNIVAEERKARYCSLCSMEIIIENGGVLSDKNILNKK